MTGNYGEEPEFDDEIVEEYRRKSAEEFQRPPSASLRQAPKKAPFTWPGIDQRRDTLALQRDELRQAIEDPAHDVSASSKPTRGATWVLDLGEGPLLALPSDDVVLGRKPGTIPGCSRMQVEDPGRTLSKSHVRLTLEGGRWLVEDLGSTNGTAIIEVADDGEETERVIHPGEPAHVTEHLRIGTLRVRLRSVSGGDA